VKSEKLPGRFFNTRNVTIGGEFSEANTTDAKETHVASLAMTELATIVRTNLVLWLFANSTSLRDRSIFVAPGVDECLSGHEGERLSQGDE